MFHCIHIIPNSTSCCWLQCFLSDDSDAQFCCSLYAFSLSLKSCGVIIYSSICSFTSNIYVSHSKQFSSDRKKRGKWTKHELHSQQELDDYKRDISFPGHARIASHSCSEPWRSNELQLQSGLESLQQANILNVPSQNHSTEYRALKCNAITFLGCFPRIYFTFQTLFKFMLDKPQMNVFE